MERHTAVSTEGSDFLINGRLTYERRYWRGNRIEGLLLNARLVQGIFDDLNHRTRHHWAYPDTNVWDPKRNTDEFIAAMPHWWSHGLLCFRGKVAIDAMRILRVGFSVVTGYTGDYIQFLGREISERMAQDNVTGVLMMGGGAD